MRGQLGREGGIGVALRWASKVSIRGWAALRDGRTKLLVGSAEETCRRDVSLARPRLGRVPRVSPGPRSLLVVEAGRCERGSLAGTDVGETGQGWPSASLLQVATGARAASFPRFWVIDRVCIGGTGSTRNIWSGMERVRSVWSRSLAIDWSECARRGLGGVRVLVCVLAASGTLVLVGGAGALARRVGVLSGGIYLSGGPAPPYGCYDQRCPAGQGVRVVVRNRGGVIVARTRLKRRGQKFRFTLMPGHYTVKARCAGSAPRSVRVFSGRATRVDLYCGIR